jgi:quercetin dioxygenase-like cupin family protein
MGRVAEGAMDTILDIGVSTKSEEGAMADVVIRRFEKADETRTFKHGTFEMITLGGITVGRASYEPGWVWSEHVGRDTGESLCQVEHVGLVVSGRTGVKMADDSEYELAAGDLFHVPAGHDSWVIGEEPYVSLHFLGAADYAKRS